MKKFLSLNQCSKEDISLIMKYADEYAKNPANECGKKYNGTLLINVFFENSTRTKTSFDIAAKSIGMGVVNLDISTSSLHKGESVLDTIANIACMQPSIIVIRSGFTGFKIYDLLEINCSIINAGDGMNEHPVQALQDLHTIRRNSLGIRNAKIAICGDFLHSRVAHSSISLLTRFNYQVSVVSPKTTLDSSLSRWIKKSLDVDVYHDYSDGVRGADFVIMLRSQKERMNSCYMSSEAEYFKKFGANDKNIYFAPRSKILHPGPVGKNIDISHSLYKNKLRSLVLDQVFHGICIKKSILKLILEN